MQLYGSVLKVNGRLFQLWYSVIHKPWNMLLAYAESDDGIHWRKPPMDIYMHHGQRTNIIFTSEPHGPAVIYDEDDPREDWKYKMVAGVAPSGCIHAFHSPNGIRWIPVSAHPVIGTNPDCPMGLLRIPDGRYVVYYRLSGYGRRVFRSESWDFKYWSSEPRMVLEPGPRDPPQLQFYGLGSVPYGPYEIGTLWIYHTQLEDRGIGKTKGYQEAEFVYARSGYAWNRPMQDTAFIPHGEIGSWEQGNLQCASAPVFLDEEIRYYYMGATMFHQRRWDIEPQSAGLGMASVKPDRFMAFEAEKEAELMTVAFSLTSSKLFINAFTEKDGWIKVEIMDVEARPIPSIVWNPRRCPPITGLGRSVSSTYNANTI